MKSIEEKLQLQETERLRRERLEHRDVLLAISAILKTKEGVQLFSYIFKNFDVTCVPERGMNEKDLNEYLGFLRAGNSIFKLACEADNETSASILSKLERQRYEDLYAQYRMENGINEAE